MTRFFPKPLRATFFFLFTAVGAFYASATRFDFLNFDDPIYVTENPIVRQGITLHGIRWAFTTHTLGHWHPITWISHMLDVSMFGMDPGGHHLVSILWFSGCVVAVFLALLELGIAIEAALLGAVFFAFHPLRPESVVWVCERKDVLSFFFGMASWLCFRYERMRTAFVLFLASLAAKPTFVTLPLLLMMTDRHFGIRRPWRRYLPWILGSVASATLAIHTQRTDGAIQPLSLADRLSGALVSLGAYARTFAWPFPTSIFHPRVDPRWEWTLLTAALIAFAATWVIRKGSPLARFGGWWFLITSLPLIGIVPIGGQAYADRWTLLPHVGLLIAATSFLRTTFAKGVAIALLCGFAWSTHRELPHWRNSESIFRHALAADPDNFMAHTNLGAALAAQRRFDEADPHYRLALRDRPQYPQAQNNYGVLLARQGRCDQALAYFERALSQDATLSSARFNLGQCRETLGQAFAALQEWLPLLAFRPEHPDLRRRLSTVAPAGACDRADARRLRAWIEATPFSSPSDRDLGLETLDRVCTQ